MIVRASSRGAGKLVRVTLSQIQPRYRQQVARRLRESWWDTELRPDTGYSPDMQTRCRVLLASVQIEAAANHPSERGYYVPLDVADDAIRKHGEP